MQRAEICENQAVKMRADRKRREVQKGKEKGKETEPWDSTQSDADV